jgi:Dickkopf N-terminal cysteine-rich region
MRSTGLFGLAGIAALLLSTSCSHTPESFCQSWVESTCTAITSCCGNGESFDQEGCQIALSDECLKATDVDQIQDGQYQFDSSAAETCFGTISSCGAFEALTTDATFAHDQACGNMVTGFRPAGAACNASADCTKNGDYSTCYDGTMNGTNGVCAAVVSDSHTCSFSFSTFEVHVCADGLFCDTTTVMSNPSAPPSSQAYEFTASCVPMVALGGSCAGVGNAPGLPCTAGTFCDTTGTNVATCTQLFTAGTACTAATECAAGLTCAPTTGGMGQTCQTADSSYCYSPTTTTTKCGDGVCTPPETPITCPQDCGTMPTCAATCAAAITGNLTVCPGDATSAGDYADFTSCAESLCDCGADTSTWSSDMTCVDCLGQMCGTEEMSCGMN